MPSIFPKTEEFLKTFYTAKRSLYESLENDFHPRKHRHYGYSDIKEIHRNEIHESAKGFLWFFGNENDILDLRVPETFGTPKKAIQALIDYSIFLEKDIAEMNILIQEYKNLSESPLPIRTIIKESQEIIDVLDFILESDEIAPFLDEELYNIYVSIPFNHECYFGFNKQDLEKLFDAIREGKEFVRIDGRKIQLKGFDSLLIYNNLFAASGSDKASLKDIIPKTQSIHKFKLKTELLSNFGQDVTSDFTIPDPPEEINHENLPTAQTTSNKNKGKRIFVSHSSDDEKLVSAFVEKVLILGMGVDRDDIFYTSGVGTGIKSGEDFKKRIADEMKNAKAVIQILTPNYKSSEVCLNEMGAAWAISDIVIPLLGPPYNYDTGFLHASDQQVKLNDKTALFSMFDDHKDDLFKVGQKSGVLHRQIEEFVNGIDELIKKDA